MKRTFILAMAALVAAIACNSQGTGPLPRAAASQELQEAFVAFKDTVAKSAFNPNPDFRMFFHNIMIVKDGKVVIEETFDPEWPADRPQHVFSASKTELELITRRIIKQFEGDMNNNVEKYTDSTTPEYARMVGEIARQLNLDSLKFSTIDTLVNSIGLPRQDLCLHCFDGSSAFTLEEENK